MSIILVGILAFASGFFSTLAVGILLDKTAADYRAAFAINLALALILANTAIWIGLGI